MTTVQWTLTNGEVFSKDFKRADTADLFIEDSFKRGYFMLAQDQSVSFYPVSAIRYVRVFED